MRWFALIPGLLCCFGVVLDAIQTIILPRRPKGRFRLTRLFYVLTWVPLVLATERLHNRSTRERIYSAYGPVSLLLLLGMWATLLVTGYACIYFALGTPFIDALNPAGHFFAAVRTDLYVSGTTLFTLGLGDVIPQHHLARTVVVLESGTGLGFVALVIGYLPVLYQTFSHREISVALLDGRAGSPPTAAELLRRYGHEGGEAELIELLMEWERWSAELLESHVSYPILCYYRSQHDNQSWLAALVCILDACSLIITTVEGPPVRQAQLTFAMARHAVIDLGHVFHVEGRADVFTRAMPDRLPDETFSRLCESLGDIHLQLCGDRPARQRLAAIRKLYEEHAWALSHFLKMPLPLWIIDSKPADSWKKVADLRRSPQDPLQAITHVSGHSTAGHLHDEEHGF